MWVNCLRSPVLSTSMSPYFFEGLSKRAGRVPGGAISLEHVREAEALVAAFQRIPDPDQRRRIVSLLKACVDSGSY